MFGYTIWHVMSSEPSIGVEGGTAPPACPRPTRPGSPATSHDGVHFNNVTLYQSDDITLYNLYNGWSYNLT